MRSIRPQQGAALLTAMLTVTLVATFATTALWQQWRGVEIEAAERVRSQQVWMLTGALDWARLILREDARSSQVDHLSEPWSLPLQEVRLSSFLALDANHTDDIPEVFLSGQISDLQSRMNVLNLVADGEISEPARRAFGRLFALQDLPESQLDLLTENLKLASDAGQNDASVLLPPQRMEHLTWLGLSAQTLQILRPHITLLPVQTPVNLNTASAEVIYASVPGLDMEQTQRLVNARASAHFRTVAEALQNIGVRLSLIDAAQLSVSSNFFEVQGRLRMAQHQAQERSVVERQNLNVKVLWRQREVLNVDLETIR